MFGYLTQDELLDFAKSYFDTSEETLLLLAHSNIYVYRDNGKIRSYLIVAEGYQIMNYHFENHDEEILLEEVKARYDELVVACPDTFFEEYGFVHEEEDVYSFIK